jgi:hypothetical protein
MSNTWKSTKLGLSLPDPLVTMADERAKQEGYPSRSAYIAGLILFDYYCGRRHWLTAQLMNEPKEILDRVIQEVIENPGRSSSWFEHRIEELMKERKAIGQ